VETEIKAQPVEKPKPEPVVEKEKPKAADDDDDFDFTPAKGPLEKLEDWAKAGNGMGFWFRVKALILVPFLILLGVVAFILTSSLNEKDEEIERLQQEEARLTAMISELTSQINTLESDKKILDGRIQTLTTENERFRRAQQQRTQQQQRRR